MKQILTCLYARYLQGADFVEFDVQLSKDNVPVIYHDFTVCLSLKKVCVYSFIVGVMLLTDYQLTHKMQKVYKILCRCHKFYAVQG